MVDKKFYSLPDGYSKVIKKDIYEGKTVFLRKELHNGEKIPYKHNVVGRYRIGISREPYSGSYKGVKWVYCSELCKLIEK